MEQSNTKVKELTKAQMSKEKILNAAMIEFGTQSYDQTSMNILCKNHKISKGLIYHYFENKDELYLCCVKRCFDILNDYLYSKEFVFTDCLKDIDKILKRRAEFLKNNPIISNVFYYIILQSPKHLKDEIREIRSEFDKRAVVYFRRAISTLEFRDGVSEEDVIEVFLIIQDMYESYMQSGAYEASDLNTLIESRENKLSKLLNIMVRGVVKDVSR